MLRKTLRKCRGSGRRFAKSDDGSSAVEFAMVSIPFFYLLGAVFELGLMMFTEYTLQASVQAASRLIRTGQAQNGSMSADSFKGEICKNAGILIDCVGSATVYVNSKPTFAQLQTATPAMTDVGPTGAKPYTPGGASETTTIIVTYDWNFVLPFMKAFGNIEGGTKRRLVGFAMFRNEPF